MFRSTTLKLTGWYLLVLMTLSIIFSVIIYQITCQEVYDRLVRFEESVQVLQEDYGSDIQSFEDYRISEQSEAMNHIRNELISVNVFVLVLGGFLSYYLARRHLRPIEEAHQSQSRFTSDASHELRTPLAVMKLEIETALKDKKISSDELKNVLQSNLEEVEKLSSLAEILLSLSKMENSKIDLGPVNLLKITKQVISDYKIPNKRVELKNSKNPVIIGNETAINELIRILVDNAIQYSPKNTKIVINLKKTDGKGIFEISNEGEGIHPDKMPYIFERFFRADSSRTSTDSKNFGLGLALAKKIVELHNGTLRVTSGIKSTTTFTVMLPLFNKRLK
jgi:signal transduction histidine kinase